MKNIFKPILFCICSISSLAYSEPRVEPITQTKTQILPSCHEVYTHPDSVTAKQHLHDRYYYLGTGTIGEIGAIITAITGTVLLPMITVPILLAYSTGNLVWEAYKSVEPAEALINDKAVDTLILEAQRYADLGPGSSMFFEKFWKKFFAPGVKQESEQSFYTKNQVASSIIWLNYAREGMCNVAHLEDFGGKTQFKYLKMSQVVENLKAFLKLKKPQGSIE